MLLPRCLRNIFSKTGCASLVGLLSLSVAHSVMSAPAQTPLFVTAPVKPIMMLNMSNDHQLFFKAYDDYSDLTDSRETIDGVANPNYGGAPDGVADTTYVHGYDYYGYFDSTKCYTYGSGVFTPTSISDDKYCDGEWSGNFLNWATMTRIDAVRKILYGGYRSSDTATETILERAFLPNDAHSFTKYYNGTDIDKLTPFDDVTTGETETADTGITICNTTNPATRTQYSQAVTSPPLMMVAEGNYSLWASNERWQCRWGHGSNGNDSDVTGIYAHSSSPTTDERLGGGNFRVRVKACVSDALVGEEKCGAYGSRLKPVGLLQEFGQNGGIEFGLITGSYSASKSGGALRKNVGSISDEIDADGTFEVPTNGNSIIKTLDLLRVYGYDFDEGIYNDSAAGGDNCPWALTDFLNGRCSNWGNPQSEIYLESLRYLAGLSQTAVFDVNDSSRITGLNTATWTKPITDENYCAPINVLQFNASTSSYDGDELEDLSSFDIVGQPPFNLNTVTNTVGENEGIHGGTYLVGETTGITDQLCTPKQVNSLAGVRGTCPDAPRLSGSYQIAGLSYFARDKGIPLTGVTKASRQTVRTLGVSLSPAVPKVDVAVPGGNKKITILPACRNNVNTTRTNCAIVDFKVIEQETNVVDDVTVNSGRLYVNWEDSEQGGDYDQDMWGIIGYEVSADKAVITTQVIAQSTGDPMGFGYVISGTTSDGFKVHSGANNFIYESSCTAVDGNRCTCRISGSEGGCNSTQSGARSASYEIGTSTAQTLEQPLYYAAKWGGYTDALIETAVETEEPLIDLISARDASDSYFFATDPRELETALRAAFQKVVDQIGTASSVATNSTRLVEGSSYFQALFSTVDWSGSLQALTRVKVDHDDAESSEYKWVEGNSTDETFVTDASLDTQRVIYTANESATALVSFEWNNLSDWQQEQLLDAEIEGDDTYNAAAPARAQARLKWIRGDRTNEGVTLRERTNLLGDIVNSSPVFSGNKSARYNLLPGDAGAEYASYSKEGKKVIYVGANDGMLHAFNAETMEEIFAYIPTAVYPKLANLTRSDYGSVGNQHQYLVDGSLYVGDAFLGGSWKTILFGSLGAGGRAVFALDVTEPTNPKLMFELGTDDYPQLGYVLGQPAIVPLKNSRWGAVFGNGSEAGTSQLFVIDLEAPKNPAHTKVIDTGSGSGLFTPALLPNGLGQIEYAYAGDLEGNVWKFNLSSSEADDWGLSFGEPLFEALDANGRAQPITGGLTLGANELIDSSIMVYFGTGKYFEPGDNATYNASTDPQHSFYAIVDRNVAINYTDRDDILHRKTFSQYGGEREISGEKEWVADDEEDEENEAGAWESLVDWANVDGWYLDFNNSESRGERVITKPILLMDRLIFNTVVPSQSACDFGGTSWGMELIAVGDKNLGHSVMGENANKQLDELVVGESGIMTGKGGPEKGAKLDCNVLGNCESKEMNFWDGWRGRMNWRQMQ